MHEHKVCKVSILKFMSFLIIYIGCIRLEKPYALLKILKFSLDSSFSHTRRRSDRVQEFGGKFFRYSVFMVSVENWNSETGVSIRGLRWDGPRTVTHKVRQTQAERTAPHRHPNTLRTGSRKVLFFSVRQGLTGACGEVGVFFFDVLRLFTVEVQEWGSTGVGSVPGWPTREFFGGVPEWVDLL